MKPKTKQYIGDSVFAEQDNEYLKLTTENGCGPTNTIYLEQYVVDALLDYLEIKKPQQATGERELVHELLERVKEMRRHDLEAAKSRPDESEYYYGRAHRCDDIEFWIQNLESKLPVGAQQPTDGALRDGDYDLTLKLELAKQRVEIVERLMKLPYIKATRNTETGQERFIARDDVITLLNELRALAEQASSDPLDKPSHVENAAIAPENHEIWGLLRRFVNASDKVQISLRAAQILHPENFIQGGVEQLLEGWKSTLHKLMSAVAEERSTTQKLQRATPGPLDKPRRD